MAAQGKELAKSLNCLLEVCLDCIEGYKDAAEEADRADVIELFETYADQRRQFADDLGRRVSELGETPDDDQSALGEVFERWVHIKAGLAENDDLAMLSACEKMERRTLDLYEAELVKDLPDDALEVVRRQYEAVKSAYESVKQMTMQEMNRPNH